MGRIAAYSGLGVVSKRLRHLLGCANLIFACIMSILGAHCSSSSTRLLSLFRLCDFSARKKERSPHLPAALLIKSVR